MRNLKDTQSAQAEIEKNARHNIFFNFMDGTSFWFGYSFMAPAVILPLFVSHYTHSKIIIGLVALISSVGYFMPQLFTANWVEHIPIKRDIPVKVGFFVERIPLLLMPLLAWLCRDTPALALVAFFTMFAWHTFGAGVIAVGWNDMIAKIIPLRYRGRFMGVTNFSGTATGILGAMGAAWLLTRFTFPYGFIYAFAIAGLFVLISWGFLSQTREPPVANHEHTVSTVEYWSRLPGIWRGDANFRRYIISQAMLNLSGLAWGFIAVYAAQRWNLSDGKVGEYTIAMLVGQALANLVLGPLGDRHGYKLVIELSNIAAIITAVLCLVARQPIWFFAVFALRGVTNAGFMLSMMITYEFSSPEVRPTYIGMTNTITGIASGISPILGGLVAQRLGYPALFQATLGLIIIGVVMMHFWVREPRKHAKVAATQD